MRYARCNGDQGRRGGVRAKTEAEAVGVMFDGDCVALSVLQGHLLNILDCLLPCRSLQGSTAYMTGTHACPVCSGI